MKQKLTSGIMAVMMVALFVSMVSCASPRSEYLQAKNAIAEAKRAGGERYAGSELASAERALERGKNQMALLQYEKAREEFQIAYQKATLAREAALQSNQYSTSVQTRMEMVDPQDSYAGPADEEAGNDDPSEDCCSSRCRE